jgi:protein gp37
MIARVALAADEKAVIAVTGAMAAVSLGCDFCYAETMAARYGWAEWGAGKPRHRTSDANWLKPLKWNAAAERTGERRRVFNCLANVFDAEVADAWRTDLFELSDATPALQWLLLIKRPQVAAKWFDGRRVPDNVALGTTAEDQKIEPTRDVVLKIDREEGGNKMRPEMMARVGKKNAGALLDGIEWREMPS